MENIAPELADESNCTDLSELFYKTHISKASNLFHKSLGILQNDFPTLSKYCDWTLQTDQLSECWLLLKDCESETVVVEASLYLCCILERSLVNLVLQKSKNVPFLLKDLIRTQELKEIIGTESIVLLALLLGSPFSLNLRNLLWHGFLTPKEIPRLFATSLFATITTIGCNLKENNIPDLYSLYNLNHFASGSFGWCNMLLAEDKEEVMNIIFDSPFVLNCMKSLWGKALQYYWEKKWGRCLCLLLPQVETFLRCCFITINNCPSRLLTAENSAFYTTIDEILSQHLQDGTVNKLQAVLGDSVLEMLFDLFVLPSGPRIRDKVSHGEVAFNEVPGILVNQVISVVLCVCIKTGFQRSTMLIEKFHSYINNYHSQFHISSQVKVLICDCNEQLLELYRTPNPFGLTIEQSHSSHNDSNFKSNIHPKVIFCTKEESEFWAHCKVIILNLQTVLSQIKTTLTGKYDKFCTKQMHSRQRASYKQMVECMSSVYKCIETVLSAMVTIYSNAALDKFQAVSDLKKLLQFVETLVSYTHDSKNKWNNVIEVSNKFWKDNAAFVV